MVSLFLAIALGAQWPTFAHDDQRTGFQTVSTITAASVTSLHLKWSRALGETPAVLFTSSPIVVDGVVYVASRGGWLYALDAADGSTRWRTHLGVDIRMTPAYVNGRLLVGIYGFYHGNDLPKDASIQSIDPANGNVLWKQPLPGVERSDPVVVDGTVYIGTAGGDAEAGGTNGRVLTFDEKTGTPKKWSWFTTPHGHAGGGVWSPLSYDGGLIFFGTGVTTDGSGHGQSAIAVDTKLNTVWVLPQHIGQNDEDSGSGVSIFGDTFYSASKAGFIYAYDRATGKLKWKQTVHADHIGGGGNGTPAGDGTVIVRSSGDGSSEPPYKTKLIGFSLTGQQLWEIEEHETATSSLGASFVKGVGFAGIDKSIIAFAPTTGKVAWTYATADFFYAVPAIVGDSVYAVDLSGNVYAFALNATTGRSELINPPAPPLTIRTKIAIGAAVLVLIVLAGVLMIVRRSRNRSRRTIA